IVRLGSGELVHLADAFIQGQAPDVAQLRQLLSPLFASAEALDAIVLGCTHFPLLTEFLAQAVPHPVHWVDSGEAIARRVQHLLAQSHMPIALEAAASERHTSAVTPLSPLSSHSHVALCTKPLGEAMIRGIQRFGFDDVRL